MKLINRNTDYAVRALCRIAKDKNKVVSVPDLVRELRIPRPFLRKILQALNRNGILHSYKGKGGGFLLAKPASKIYLVDLIGVFQGRLSLNECIFKKKLCPNKDTCALRQKISEIESHTIRQLQPITIGSLLKSGDKL